VLVSAVSTCQLCGNTVNIEGAVAICPNCGAEYDVIRHGRRGDFSKSPERTMSAAKKPTSIGCSLWDEGRTKRLEGTTQWVGTRIQINVDLWDRTVNYTPLAGKEIRIYHKVDGGAWSTWVGLPNASELGPNFYKLIIPLSQAGVYTVYAEFLGDDVYLGCEETVHGLKVHGQDYGVSPEVSLEAAPALTVVVKEMIFNKPIEGAKVVVDTNEAVTDSSGMAVFDMLAPGTYTLIVSARDYKSETRTVILTAAGVVAEVHLLHLAAIALGLVAVGSVGVVVVHQATKRK